MVGMCVILGLTIRDCKYVRMIEKSEWVCYMGSVQRTAWICVCVVSH